MAPLVTAGPFLCPFVPGASHSHPLREEGHRMTLVEWFIVASAFGLLYAETCRQRRAADNAVKELIAMRMQMARIFRDYGEDAEAPSYQGAILRVLVDLLHETRNANGTADRQP